MSPTCQTALSRLYRTIRSPSHGLSNQKSFCTNDGDGNIYTPVFPSRSWILVSTRKKLESEEKAPKRNPGPAKRSSVLYSRVKRCARSRREIQTWHFRDRVPECRDYRQPRSTQLIRPSLKRRERKKSDNP